MPGGIGFGGPSQGILDFRTTRAADAYPYTLDVVTPVIRSAITTGNTVVLPEWQPVAGEAIFVGIGYRATTITVTIAGNGLTWTIVQDKTGDRTQQREVVWQGTGTPTPGAVTLTFGTANTNPAVAAGIRVANANLTPDASSATGTGGTDLIPVSASVTSTVDGDLVLYFEDSRRVYTDTTTGSVGDVINVDSVGTAGAQQILNVRHVPAGTAGVETVTGNLASSDDWIVIAIALKLLTASVPQLVTPDTAALTIAAFAPQANLGIIPDTGALTLATFAPVLALGIVPATASLTLSTFAPTVSVSANQTSVPGTASLASATFAPVIGLGVVPGTAALSTAAFAPSVTITNNQLVVPSTASLSTATFAPTVTATNQQTVVPGTGALTLATFAPTVSVSANQSVVPGTASLTISSFAPTVSVSANVTVVPATAGLSLTGFAPVVSAGSGATVVPDTLALVLQGYEPLVLLSGGGGVHMYPIPGPHIPKGVKVPGLRELAEAVPIAVSPGTARLSLATFAPDVRINDDELVLELI